MRVPRSAFAVLAVLLVIALLYLFLRQSRRTPSDLTSLTFHDTYTSIAALPEVPALSPPQRLSQLLNVSLSGTDQEDQTHNDAICIVSPTYSKALLDAAYRLQSLAHNSITNIKTTVYLLIDSVDADEARHTVEGNGTTTSSIYIVSVDGQQPARHGFRLTDGFNIKKDVHGWDKAYWLFARSLKGVYSFVWLVEWDAFIPSSAAWEALQQAAAARPLVDLVVAPFGTNLDGHTHHTPAGSTKPSPDWHWQRVAGPTGMGRLPWHNAMMCVHGLSSKMLEHIDAYATKHGRLQFIEVFAVTLAAQMNLTVVASPLLSTLVAKKEPSWTCDDVRQRPLNIFHPVKHVGALNHCLA